MGIFKRLRISEETLRNVWLEPGTDHRKPFNEQNKRIIIKTPFFNRIPMGEKGIGRFAVHRIANFIKVITRPKSFQLDDNKKPYEVKLENYEIELTVDWEKIQEAKYLTDVRVQWDKKENQSEFYFKNKSGTLIELSKIKEPWTKSMAVRLNHEILSMPSPPFKKEKIADKKEDIAINLNFHNNWLKDFPDIQEVIDHAPFKFSAILNDNYDLNFDYSFNPRYSNINKTFIKDKTINIKNKLIESISLQLKKEKIEEDDIEKFKNKNIGDRVKFGPILIEINSYILEAKALHETMSNHTVIKNTLMSNSGIKVYKGDLRVYNYGEVGNDWLNLDQMKNQRRQGTISNKQNLGYIQLQPEDSIDLIEKTNREGFIDNDTFKIFSDIILLIIKEFLAIRFSDNDRWIRSLKGLSENDVRSEFRELLEEVDKNEGIDPKSKKSLIDKIGKIDQKIEEERKNLLIPAMLGMSSSMAIHELEKLVPRMHNNINKTPLSIDRLKENVYELDNYVGNLVEIIKRRGFQKETIKLLLEKVIDDYEYKLKKYKTKVELGIIPENLKICCERRSLIPALMNIIDNNIYWLSITRSESERFIYLNALIHNDKIRIIIADNGNGFEDSLNKVVMPFFTRKPDGMGIGLYLVDQVMMSHGKFNIILDKNIMNDMQIPGKYLNGAIVELIFDKENQCRD